MKTSKPVITTSRKGVSLIAVFLGTALVAVIIVAYWPILTELAWKLYHDSDYSFGLLLPLVAAYIAYLKWPQIRDHLGQPSWYGLIILGLGFCIYIAGELITDFYIPMVSFVLVLTGLLWLVGGWPLVRLLFFPLILLVFMVPLPFFIIKKLTLPLQLLSSRLAAEILNVIGCPAVRQGNVIDLGVRQLQVVEACSGLRYLLALFALGMVFCYFYQRRVWKAAILILAVIPAAILANAFRVAAMGLLPMLQKGFWHEFSGWLIFVFCSGLLLLINGLLEKLSPENQTSRPRELTTETALSTPPRISYVPYFLAALLIVLMCGPVALRVSQTAPTPLLQSFDNFPLQLGNWQGKREYIDPEIVAATQCNAYLDAQYKNPENGSISLWIAYYENQRKGGASVHSPFSCFRGSGWIVVKSETLYLAPGYPVKYMVVSQGGNRLAMYYWFIQSGKWITNEYLNKLVTGYDSLVKRRSDGALVRIIAPILTDEESARKHLEDFAKVLKPELSKFIQE